MLTKFAALNAKLEEKRQKQATQEEQRVAQDKRLSCWGTLKEVRSQQPASAEEVSRRLYGDAAVARRRLRSLQRKVEEEERLRLEAALPRKSKRARSEPPRSEKQLMHDLYDQAIFLRALKDARLVTSQVAEGTEGVRTPQPKMNKDQLKDSVTRLWAHGAQATARREAKQLELQREADSKFWRTCCCGHVAEGPDPPERCAKCGAKRLQAQPGQSCDKEHHENMLKRAGVFRRSREEEAERHRRKQEETMRGTCPCGATFDEWERCRRCYTRRPRPMDDARVDMAHLEHMHVMHQKHREQLDERREAFAEQSHVEMLLTCACGYFFDPKDERLFVERCPQCGCKRYDFVDNGAREEVFGKDPALGVVAAFVANRCGGQPKVVASAFKELSASLQNATMHFSEASKHSQGSYGWNQMAHMPSMRMVGSGDLTKDVVVNRTGLEPEPIRQLYEDLDALLMAAERAQEVLMSRLAAPSAVQASVKKTRSECPVGAHIRRPAAVRSAAFAYNPGVKSRSACEAKAMALYGPCEGSLRYRHLMDVARACLVFMDADQLRAGLQHVCTAFTVVDIRNMYQPSMANILGEKYVEVLVSIKSERDGLPVPFVCEIRLMESVFYHAREEVANDVAAVAKGFRSMYKAGLGKDLDVVEYIARYAMNHPTLNLPRRRLRGALNARYGSTVSAWRHVMGNSNHVSFIDFREACQQAGLRREQVVEHWRALDPGRGGRISLFEVDPEAAILLARLHGCITNLADRSMDANAIVERLANVNLTPHQVATKRAEGLPQKPLVLPGPRPPEGIPERVASSAARQPKIDAEISMESFRSALKTFGFTGAEAERLFCYLDNGLIRDRWLKANANKRCSATVTAKDIRWLMNFPQLVDVDAVLITAGSTSTPRSSRALLNKSMPDTNARNWSWERRKEHGHLMLEVSLPKSYKGSDDLVASNQAWFGTSYSTQDQVSDAGESSDAGLTTPGQHSRSWSPMRSERSFSPDRSGRRSRSSANVRHSRSSANVRRRASGSPKRGPKQPPPPSGADSGTKAAQRGARRPSRPSSPRKSGNLSRTPPRPAASASGMRIGDDSGRGAEGIDFEVFGDDAHEAEHGARRPTFQSSETHFAAPPEDLAVVAAVAANTLRRSATALPVNIEKSLSDSDRSTCSLMEQVTTLEGALDDKRSDATGSAMKEKYRGDSPIGNRATQEWLDVESDDFGERASVGSQCDEDRAWSLAAAEGAMSHLDDEACADGGLAMEDCAFALDAELLERMERELVDAGATLDNLSSELAEFLAEDEGGEADGFTGAHVF